MSKHVKLSLGASSTTSSHILSVLWQVFAYRNVACSSRRFICLFLEAQHPETHPILRRAGAVQSLLKEQGCNAGNVNMAHFCDQLASDQAPSLSLFTRPSHRGRLAVQISEPTTLEVLLLDLLVLCLFLACTRGWRKRQNPN